MVKNLPAIQETWVQSLGQEDPLENEMPAHSNILPWRIPWMRSQVGYSPWGHKELDITKRLTLILKKKKILLGLSFLMWKMGIILLASISSVCCKDKLYIKSI